MLSAKVRTTPPDLMQKISDAPRNARGPMTQEAAWFLVGETVTNYRGLKHYPPPPPQSKYKRTYILREGWGFAKYGAAIKVVNPVAYAPYVQGDKEQAWMHKGRWRTVSKVIADNMKGMLLAAERALQRYLKEKGL